MIVSSGPGRLSSATKIRFRHASALYRLLLVLDSLCTKLDHLFPLGLALSHQVFCGRIPSGPHSTFPLSPKLGSWPAVSLSHIKVFCGGYLRRNASRSCRSGQRRLTMGQWTRRQVVALGYYGFTAQSSQTLPAGRCLATEAESQTAGGVIHTKSKVLD